MAQGCTQDRLGLEALVLTLTQWTGVCASSRRWGGTGQPGMLQLMGSQRVKGDLVTENNYLHHTPLGSLLWIFLLLH